MKNTAQHQDVTAWIAGDVDPAHIGPYQRDYSQKNDGSKVAFAFWNGEGWGIQAKTAALAVSLSYSFADHTRRPWRGLSKAALDVPHRPSWDLSLEELEATAWALHFNETCRAHYDQALAFARTKDLRVRVYETNEIGELRWAIQVVGDPEAFWMESKPTQEEALALCQQMGWVVKA